MTEPADLPSGGREVDIEIAVPRQSFPQIAAALAGFDWEVAGSGRLWPYADVGDNPDLYQTWCRDPATGRYHLDVFREPHVAEMWVCRRDPSITLPYRGIDQIPRRTPLPDTRSGTAVQSPPHGAQG
ncbi:hypothetical protein [Mycolicibacterium lutetiense]